MNISETIISKVDWDTWVHHPGLSPVNFTFRTPEIDQAEKQALDALINITEHEIEEVRKERGLIKDGTKEYLVKWMRYPVCTWEPLDSFDANCAPLQDYKKSKSKKRVSAVTVNTLGHHNKQMLEALQPNESERFDISRYLICPINFEALRSMLLVHWHYFLVSGAFDFPEKQSAKRTSIKVQSCNRETNM